MADKFVIIDGSSLMYRAFYALPLLTDSEGRYTNAAYGFVKMFIKIMEDFQPDTVVVAFDKGKKTFRNELYADYKGKRKATPDELLSQIPLIHELVEVMGVKLIEEAGFEADDIIGTLAVKAAEAGHSVRVVTGDRDALQLVEDNIQVALTKKGITELEIYNTEYFKEKYGLEPVQLIDLKGLMGDASDNIPGVPGVGEKTASKLLKQFGSVEEVLANVDVVSGKKLQERLRDNAEQAVLSKKLATIITDMPLEYDTAMFKMQTDTAKLKAFCQKHGFRSVMNQLTVFGEAEADEFGFGTVENVAQELPQSEEIFTREAAAELMLRLRTEGQMAFKPVYSGSVPNIFLSALYIADKNGHVFYVNNNSMAFEPLLELLTDVNIAKITHDFKTLYKTGAVISGVVFDTMLAAYLLEPTRSQYSLNELVNNYNYEFPYEEPIDEHTAGVYEALAVAGLYPILKKRLDEDGAAGLYKCFELPLLEVLAAMEQAGICVDRQHLQAMSAEYGKKLETLLADIYALAGIEFNVNSPKQLGQILFERLQLPIIKKTKNGYSTDAEVLEKLYHEHPIIPLLLTYRKLAKLKSTYLDGLDILINPADNRIYAKFNQMVTATGRLSSSEPNLQNIPVRTEEGRRIRELFVPGEGYDYLVSADYSQIELRILAHMSQDKNFLDAFSNQEDIHARTAAEVFGVPLNEVDSELRSRAKAVNFGIVYGISDFGLAKDLNVTRKEAAQYIESYFEKCPGIKGYIDSIVEQARSDGFVTTLFGRRRYLPDINSRNYTVRSFAERTAMNTPIQGTAADVIKKAMIDVYDELKRRGLKSRIIVQVHDELLLEVTESEFAEVTELLKMAMPNAVQLSVPLTVDIHSGRCWADAK